MRSIFFNSKRVNNAVEFRNIQLIINQIIPPYLVLHFGAWAECQHSMVDDAIISRKKD